MITGTLVPAVLFRDSHQVVLNHLSVHDVPNGTVTVSKNLIFSIFQLASYDASKSSLRHDAAKAPAKS